MDKEEFAQVVWEAQDTMSQVAKLILKKDTDCEDAVSQGIVNVFEHLESWKKPQYAKIWLIRMVMNECYRLSKQKRKEQCYEQDVICIGEWKGSYDANWQEETYSELYTALCSIPQVYHAALVLYYMEEYNMTEIAKIQNTSVGNVKMRLCRGRKMLRKLIEENAGACVVHGNPRKC